MKSKGLFRFLLVLSMLWSGMSALGGILGAIILPYLQDFYTNNPALFPEETYTMMQDAFDLPRTYYLSLGLLFILEFVGALLMWRLRWSGFHCYAIARLLLLLVPILFVGRGSMGFGNVMFAVLYIALYFLLMKGLTMEGNGDNMVDTAAGGNSADGQEQA